MKIQGINLEDLNLYFLDNGNNNLYDDLLPEVKGFDESINKNIADAINEYNYNSKGDFVKAEYIFFTFNNEKYGTFLMIHNQQAQKDLINKLKILNSKNVCIKFGMKTK